MMKLAVMTWVYNKVPFERALEGIAKAGYKYVSFGLPHEGMPSFDDSQPGEAARVLELLAQYGLKPVTLVSTDALSPKQSIERSIQRLDFAKELGVEEVLSLGTSSYNKFPSEPRSDEEMKELNDAFAAKYRLVGEEAAKRSLIVTIKPHTGNTAAAQELNDTIAYIGSSSVKASYDPGNVRFYEGIDPAADLPGIASEVVSIIAKDHRGDRAEIDFPIPGEGDVDFTSVFTTLKQANFNGPVVIERLDDRGESFTADELDERIAQARQNLLKIFAEIGVESE
ncbi:MAG: Xylose isomerase-like barrel [Paenibacillus sp.]|jgi:sugar phosphate isomerase/epimerase|nr:Xylose isomerase-like barrel [Paenibacillus sp.]